MPELGPKNLDFIKNLKKKFKINQKTPWDDLPFSDQIQVLADAHNEKYIGDGAEVVVVGYRDEPNSDKLVAFNYKDVEAKKAKIIFYLHRFFSTLFPHNFPHFYKSAGKNPNDSSNVKPEENDVSGTIRQEIKKREPSASESKYVPFSFQRVLFICNTLLGIHLKYDEELVNFIVGADGGEYYVDTLDNINFKNWDEDVIVQYMEENDYSSQDIGIVKRSLERLKTLTNPNQ